MYCSFEHQGQKYYSWGKQRRFPDEEVKDFRIREDIAVYGGKPAIFNKSDSVLATMGGLGGGWGDRIWMVNFFRDIYSLKGRRQCRFSFYSNPPGDLDFYKRFLPPSFEFHQGYVPEQDFQSYTVRLPSTYSWSDYTDRADRSWIDGKSMLHRLYVLTGMQYDGLLDWGDFTDEKILHPAADFYKNMGIDKNDKFVFFQWHSKGQTKNIAPRANVGLIKHIVKVYGYKVYVIGSLPDLDLLNNIPGVVNLSGKTDIDALFHLAFASEFIVCPDSVGLDLAEAYKVPCVCIMSSLPPVYVASKYKIPAFMSGAGFCPYRPCGITTLLPKETKCPKGVINYCKVMEDVDIPFFDACLEQSVKNRTNYRRTEGKPFYSAQSLPIVME